MTNDVNTNCYLKLIESYKEARLGKKIIFGNQTIKIPEFLEDIEKFANVLNKLGFKKGDVLTIFLPTCPQAIIAFYACSKLGITSNIVHPLTSLAKLKKNLKVTHSKGLMYYDILIKNHNDLNDFGQILICCSITDYAGIRKPLYWVYARAKSTFNNRATNYRKLLKLHGGLAAQSTRPPDEDNIVVSMHSGGTSSTPKIVRFKNNAINNLCDNLYEMYTQYRSLNEGEYAIVSLPIFHAYGLCVSIHTCLIHGYNLILMAKFNPKRINRFIKRYNVTFIAGVPLIFKKMMEEKHFEGKHLAKLKDLWCGGDVVNENFIEHFDAKLKNWNSQARLMRGYGLTEVCSVCCVNNQKDYKKNSCGKPIPNTIIEIWNEAMQCLGSNQIGEIAICSNAIMDSYEDGSGITMKNGLSYIKTGDIGYLDEDGFLFVLDRKKRMIKISAINIFPSEIEEVAMLNEKVEAACAVGYSFKSKTYIRLYITLKNAWKNKISQKDIEKELQKSIESKLIKYAIPKSVVVLEEMPLTRFGKIDFKKIENL